MKNHVNQHASDRVLQNDQNLRFSDQTSADEVARLLRPVETLQRDSCTRWRSIFDAPASTNTPDA